MKVQYPPGGFARCCSASFYRGVDLLPQKSLLTMLLDFSEPRCAAIAVYLYIL